LTDGGLLDLLSGVTLFLNEDLARHYGRHYRRQRPRTTQVTLKLGSASRWRARHGQRLAMTSHTFRTSPTLRGKWVMEVLLGTPPPPPPADVQEIERNRGAARHKTVFDDPFAGNQTTRQRSTCASYHRRWIRFAPRL
jgi:hypothetical protein